jgi:hypothetical protein
MRFLTDKIIRVSLLKLGELTPRTTLLIKYYREHAEVTVVDEDNDLVRFEMPLWLYNEGQMRYQRAPVPANDDSPLSRSHKK